MDLNGLLRTIAIAGHEPAPTGSLRGPDFHSRIQGRLVTWPVYESNPDPMPNIDRFIVENNESLLDLRPSFNRRHREVHSAIAVEIRRDHVTAVGEHTAAQ